MMNTDPSLHVCELHWQGNTADFESFSRLNEVVFPGGQKLRTGPAHSMQDPAQTNPEEVFAAAVGTCMLMTILAVFSKSRVTVLSYDDKPEALLEFVERRFRVTRVTLRPRMVIDGPIEREKLENLIQKSHANCFITLSVKAEVIVEPTFVSNVTS
ncbi:MAG TPA: OsmC family protein [bacterium]|jgi:organic hydroperoxide reductase OsmC/OhrA